MSQGRQYAATFNFKVVPRLRLQRDWHNLRALLDHARESKEVLS
jgi:hypothetical protein